MPRHQRGDRHLLGPQELQTGGGQGLLWDNVPPMENGVCPDALQLLTWGTAVRFRPPRLVPSVKATLSSPTELRKQKGPVSWQPSAWAARGIVTLPRSAARRSDQGVCEGAMREASGVRAPREGTLAQRCPHLFQEVLEPGGGVQGGKVGDPGRLSQNAGRAPQARTEVARKGQGWGDDAWVSNHVGMSHWAWGQETSGWPGPAGGKGPEGSGGGRGGEGADLNTGSLLQNSGKPLR